MSHDVRPARLGEWAEEWAKMLRDDRGLKWSTIANYVRAARACILCVWTRLNV